MIRKQFKPDVYGMTLMLLAGGRDDINRALARIGQKMPDDARGFHISYGKEHDDFHAICIATEGMDRITKIRFLAHELLHVVFDVFDSRNVKYNGDSDEAFNYYFDSWLGDCLSYLI